MATIYWRKQTRGGGNFAYLNWFEGGKQQRISLGEVTTREAETARVQKEYELRHGNTALAAPTFGEFAGDYKKWHAAEYPNSEYRVRKIIDEILLPEFEFITLDQITVKLANQWKATRSTDNSRRKSADGRHHKLKASSVNKEIRTLKAILAAAVEWEIIQKHPCKGLKQIKALDSKPPLFYTVDQLRQLYEVNDERRWWWQLYANTGMRKAEGIHLRRRHIKSDSLQILSTEADRTKSGKWREVPLSPGAIEALERLPGADFILPRLNPNSFTRHAIKDGRRAGVGGNVHTLRHTFCSHLVMKGVPLRTVQKLAGHASITTTEIYAHLAPDHLRGALSGLNL